MRHFCLSSLPATAPYDESDNSRPLLAASRKNGDVGLDDRQAELIGASPVRIDGAQVSQALQEVVEVPLQRRIPQLLQYVLPCEPGPESVFQYPLANNLQNPFVRRAVKFIYHLSIDELGSHFICGPFKRSLGIILIDKPVMVLPKCNIADDVHYARMASAVECHQVKSFLSYFNPYRTERLDKITLNVFDIDSIHLNRIPYSFNRSVVLNHLLSTLGDATEHKKKGNVIMDRVDINKALHELRKPGSVGYAVDFIEN